MTSLVRNAYNKTLMEVNPSELQKEAGNYKKDHVRLYGLDISIENKKGTTRSGIDNKGNKWTQVMNNDYGYIKGTKGRDKDHLDVFIGSDMKSESVFVVNQIVPNTKRFDEHKIMLGFPNLRQARLSYLKNYNPGWKGLGSIISMTLDKFKEWIKGNTTSEVK